MKAANLASCPPILLALALVACSAKEPTDEGASPTGMAAAPGSSEQDAVAGMAQQEGAAGANSQAGAPPGGGANEVTAGSPAGAAAGGEALDMNAGMPSAAGSAGATAADPSAGAPAAGAVDGVEPDMNLGGAAAGGQSTDQAGAAGGSAAGAPAAGAEGQTGTATFDIQASLASDEDSAAPTTVGIVTWQIDAAGITDAHIEFGLDTNYGMTAPVELAEEGYRTLLLGMKPARTYHFRIVASDGTTLYTSDDQQIETGAPNTVNPISTFTVANADANLPGFYVTSFARGANMNFVFVFDQDGDVVWWYNIALANSGIMRARMSADAKSIWLVRESLQGAALQRVTMDGLEVQTYDNVVASHDITAVTGDIMAYLDYGESDCDSIFEIDNEGNVTEAFESTNVTGTAGGGISGCHGNAVRYSATEDAYTFSDHRQDVAVVERSGSVLWKLGDLVQGGNASWGGTQHGHQLLDNSIIIFANDGAPNGSAAIEYGLDGSLIREFASGGSATNFGDVQRQPNGNTVVTYASTQNIQVVDSSDNLVIEAETTGMLGYTEYRPSLYGLPLDTQM